jgi:hypothetical protein
VKRADNPADAHQRRICIDTVRNPDVGLLSGPDAEEAEQVLRTKFAATDADIANLKGTK